MYMEIKIKSRRTEWFQEILIAETTIGGRTVSEWGVTEAEAIGKLIRAHSFALGVDLSLVSDAPSPQASA